ncbi:MAG: 30S ribosomal protein S17 [Actinobacteria bacterium]|nr:30S ribosomal protein S17 [Actinomycetota bacterium]
MEIEETPEAVEETVADTEAVAEEAAAEEAVVEVAAAEAPADEPVAEEAAAPVEAAAEEAAAEEPAAEEAAASEPAAEAEEAAEEAVPVAPAGKPAKSQRHLPRSLRHKHSKPTREKPAERKPIVRTEKPDTHPPARQERRGIVVSDKGDKTIVVKVDVIKAHRKYKKVVRRTQKFHAHDEGNTAGVGDVVRIVESRPLSRLKRWRLAEIVEKAR